MASLSQLRRTAVLRAKSLVPQEAWLRLKSARDLTQSLAGRVPLPHYPGMPLLSVVVAAYNTQDYVEEALSSLLHQQWPHIEVIIVDDESTDRTPEIIEAFDAKHSRFHLIRTHHVGLGAARNIGCAYAHGEYLTFLDSDDIVDPFFYRQAVLSLERTGSDFAVGPYRLLIDGERRHPAEWIRDLHDPPRRRVSLAQVPEAMFNVPMWSKLFRREFYQRAVAPQPEGVEYEDQVPSVRAYSRARAFDLLKRQSIEWRRRDSGDSISQRAAEVTNLRARLAAWRGAVDVLEEAGLPELRRERLVQILSTDQLSLIQLPVATDEYFEQARDFVRWAMGEVGAELYDARVKLQDRVLHQLLLREDAETARSFILAGGRSLEQWVFQDDTVAGLIGWLPGWPLDHQVSVPLAARAVLGWQRSEISDDAIVDAAGLAAAIRGAWR